MQLPMVPPPSPAPRPDLSRLDFHRSPFLVIWETTRACDLACVHCRAEAQSHRDCGELSTSEAEALMREIQAMGRPLLVLTGGDPFKRPDLIHLVGYASRLGLRVGLTPSATPLVTRDALAELAREGLGQLALSLDGATPETHDDFRGTPGSFQLTLRLLDEARELGLRTQVNSTMTRRNLHEFDDLVPLLTRAGISLWSVFFLVPTGRAQTTDLPSPEEFEELFRKMNRVATSGAFDVKSTAAPHYRRLLLQEEKRTRREHRRAGLPLPSRHRPVGFVRGGPTGRAQGVNEGRGMAFVDHRGDVYPSGFLPLVAGNVRETRLSTIYRESPLFSELRDPRKLKGKCGVCEFRTVCGGSRARAYALTGDILASDPSCAYVPARWDPEAEAPAAG
ncbi:MAG: TIGR04053 family radical SAM/SPASM domain-containing protein [Gemmatimonadota bacterium]